VNEPAPALLAVQTDTWVGRSLRDVVAGSPLELDVRALLAAPTQPATCTLAYEHAAALRAVELRFRPLPADTGCAGALLLVRDRSERARMERDLENQMRTLDTIAWLARVANATAATNDVVRVIAREIVRVLPGVRVVIGMLTPDGAAVHLVMEEPLEEELTLEGQALVGRSAELLHTILASGEVAVVHVADLNGQELRDVFARSGLHMLIVVPLRHDVAPVGVLFLGHADRHAPASVELRLADMIGGLVSDAIARARLYEQAQTASRARTTFAAMITHELRTPLTSIIGYTDLLIQDVFGVLPSAATDALTRVRQSGRTMLRLVNDMLDVAKLEAGSFTIELAAVDLAAVIGDVVASMQPQLQERGLTVQVVLPPELPPVSGDRERLGQVLANLLSNAIKFTQQGSITVEATRTGERVQFRVTDTGIGIPPDQQHRLFQIFAPIDQEGAQQMRGAGLGLAISRQLMELMGGTLTVMSTPGIGSTFIGEVPLASGQLRAQALGGARC
jgi:signal transduction histidine kinase